MQDGKRLRDLFSRRVVGRSIEPTMTAQLVLDALTTALWRRGKPTELLHHSDQRSQPRLNWSSQHRFDAQSVDLIEASAGVRQPSVFRDREFKANATACRSHGRWTLRSRHQQVWPLASGCGEVEPGGGWQGRVS